MIDRLSLNYVVDFIYIKAINFPIFNVADIYVTVSTILLAIVLVFVYKDDDLRFMSFRASGFRTFDDDHSSQQGKEVTEPVKEQKENSDASE